MSILLDKVIPIFIYPTGFAVVAGFACLLFLAWGWRRSANLALMAGVLYLWLAATPAVAQFMAYTLESRFPVRAVETLPKADAIIMLGGTMHAPTPDNPYGDMDASADRIMHTLRLYRAGLAPVVIVTGGQLFPAPGKPTEADLVKVELISLGVPEAAILMEPRARNTYENAAFTVRLMREKGLASGLLVTSAWHMQRSVAVFARAGLPVTPASTDTFMSSMSYGFPLRWLPNVDALQVTTRCLKEWIGLGVYRMRGWA